MTGNDRQKNENITQPYAPDMTRCASGSPSGDNFATEFEIDDDLHEPARLAPTGIIGEYILLDCIGVGGMGEVYRAEHRTMKRQVALKLLGQSIAHKPDVIDRFFQEIRAVARMMHPNIVTAFDAGTQNGTHYLVMELVDGELLSCRVNSTGLFSTQEAVSILYQAAQALDYAHNQGIIHRDIKPNNMMLTKDGTLKILDFGLAQLERPSAEKTGRKRFMGTVEYMSPEQIEDSERVDSRSDLYSLGATLFYLVTGRNMFDGDPLQIAWAQRNERPPALYDIRSDIDLRLDAVFQRLVAKQPESRIPSARALIEAIEQLGLHESRTSTDDRFRFAFAHLPVGERPTRQVASQSTVSKSLCAVGIDLGMIASTVGFYESTLGLKICDQVGGGQHLRNMIWSDAEQIVVGAEALALRQSHPDKIFHSLQRWIGLKRVERPLINKFVPPEVLVATILRQLLMGVQSQVPEATQAVVTVPGCYDQLHRQSIAIACKIAGVELLQLLDKSLAAALSWIDMNSRISTPTSADPRTNPKLLVVHLGGGGLDASVIQVQGLNAIQKSVCGSPKLGSLRWHNRLAEYLAEQIQQKTGQSIREDLVAATRLQRTVEITMERLAKSPRIDVRFDWQKHSIQEQFTPARLVELAPALAKSVQSVVLQSLKSANTQPNEIGEVLLIGSLLTMEPVKKLVAALMPSRVPITNVPKTDLSRGAVLHAQQLLPFATVNIATPRAIGCVANDLGLLVTDPRTQRQQPRALLVRGAELPVAESRSVRPRLDSKSHILQIVEASSIDANTWMKLGAIDAAEAFPNRPANESMQLQLSVNESGLLSTTLNRLGGKQYMTVAPLSDATVPQDAISNWRDWLQSVVPVAASGSTTSQKPVR